MNSLGQLIKIIVAVLTVITGLVSLIWPRTAAKFTGFGDSVSPRGLTEMRAILGGGFISIGLAPILLGTDKVFQALGLLYLGIALARSVSILALEKDKSNSNLGSLATEWICAALLLLLQ
jgi:hypothetical protein